MKLYIHIGMSKAGSSAIQRTMIDNENILSVLGVCYPRSGRYTGAHYQIFNQLRDDSELSYLDAALKESHHSDKAVISCEGLWLLTEDRVEKLRSYIKEIDATVILYLRRPAGYLPSSYRQKIKQAGSYDSQSEYLTRVGPHMDYPSLLDRWGKHFRLRVRAYEAVKNSLEADFISAIGVSENELTIERKVVNKTPSDSATRLMLDINRLLPSGLSVRFRKIILSHACQLEYYPRLNDKRIRRFAANVPYLWDVKILRKYLSEEDMEILTRPSFLSSAGNKVRIN